MGGFVVQVMKAPCGHIWGATKAMTNLPPEEAPAQEGAKKGRESGATLASEVYDRLRDDIMTGAILPGQRLRTEFLRERYAVGNSPVREALNRLSADGLVVRQDQRGFHASKVSRQALVELVKTRCWLEEIALRQTLAGRTEEWEEGLVLAYHRLSRVPQSASGERYVHNPQWERLHRDYHMALIGACGSQWLLGFCTQLIDQADRYRLLAVRESYPRRDELAEHRAIFDATIEGDADKALGLLYEHYRWTQDIILGSNLPLLENGD